MQKTALCALVIVLAALGRATAAGPELKTEDDKTFYAVGLALSQSVGSLNLSESELALVKAGLEDGVLHKDQKKIDLQAYGPKIQQLQTSRMTVVAAAEKQASQAFLDKAASEPGAKKTASGLIYKVIKEGTGPTPKPTDKVKVNYHGTLTDGTVFDSSVQRNAPATFPLNGVIPCWTEGVQLMKVGGKSRLVCPSTIAYGDRGAPPRIKPGAALVFEVELLEIVP